MYQTQYWLASSVAVFLPEAMLPIWNSRLL